MIAKKQGDNMRMNSKEYKMTTMLRLRLSRRKLSKFKTFLTKLNYKKKKLNNKTFYIQLQPSKTQNLVETKTAKEQLKN